uniref:Uncharacterized protein n=1 Tax=viral metagenome TaxID=1070528 RepID=A0A6M3X536_9ZZZZ
MKNLCFWLDAGVADIRHQFRMGAASSMNELFRFLSSDRPTGSIPSMFVKIKTSIRNLLE